MMVDLKDILQCDRLTVYGELFGGKYPHPDVKENLDVKFVQKGPWYSPNIEFYAFDIKTEHGFLNYDECVRLFEKVGFLYAKVLKRGLLKDLIQFNVEKMETTVTNLLNLPKLEENYAEGIVLKPVNAHFIKQCRVIIKKKSQAFTEKTCLTKEELFAKKLKKQKSLLEKHGKIDAASESCKELKILMKGYVNVNRLKGLLSKLGPVDLKGLAKLIGLIAKDALHDFEIDHGEPFGKLKDEEKKQVTRVLSDCASDLIQKHGNAIIKQDF